MYIVRYGGQDHSRSWKLVPIECICDFLLVPHCNYAYFLSFPSYNDLLVENLRFCLKLSQADSPRTCVKIAIKKLCYSPGGEKPYNLTVIRLESIPACDRRTDGQMDGWRRRLVSQHTLYSTSDECDTNRISIRLTNNHTRIKWRKVCLVKRVDHSKYISRHHFNANRSRSRAHTRNTP